MYLRFDRLKKHSQPLYRPCTRREYFYVQSQTIPYRMRAPLSPPPITPDSRALRSLRLAGWQGTGRNRVYSTWNAWRSSKHAGFDTRPVISRKLCELSTHFFHIRLPCASTQFRGKNVFCVKICIEFPFRDSNTFFACLPNTPFPHKSNGDLTRR